MLTFGPNKNDINQVQNTAYLQVDGAFVYEVPVNATITIGRLDTNDIVLDDYKVSREHAVLKYVNGEFVLIDMASTHGTFVNGVRIDRQTLAEGQVFQVVTHEMVLRWEIPILANGEESPVSATKARSLDRRLKFFGGLNEFALITLVQFLYQEKQSGLLILEQGQQACPRIYFQDGEIIHLVDGENLGELLTRQKHDISLFFYFHNETEFPTRTIFTPTPTYLMELCHYQDVKDTKEANPLIVRSSPLPKVTADMNVITARLDPLPPRR